MMAAPSSERVHGTRVLQMRSGLALNYRDHRLGSLVAAHTSFPSLHDEWCGLETTTEKGGPFEDFVRLFLLLDPKYSTLLNHVWLLEEVPAPVAAHLNLPAQDKGIDLIAETKDGRYWAIQAKFRKDVNCTLTWKGDLATFVGLAFKVCRNISFGLVCATATRMPGVLREDDRIGFISNDVWFGLGDEYFARLKSALKGKATTLRPARPRPHQKAAVADVRTYFSKGPARGKLIMPCGTGKSLTAYWIAKTLKASRILVAVPSLSLINQTLTTWLREAVANKEDTSWLCVCSDPSAGRVRDDDISVLRQDLGVECYTQPDDIHAALATHSHGRLVVFCTYKSGRALAQAARRWPAQFDLAVFDEAHKTAGKKHGLFAHLLSDANIQIRRRLFMTATERRYRGESDDVASMQDPSLYGNTAHLLSFKKALDAKPPILCDYTLLTAFISRHEIADLVARNAFLRTHGEEFPEEVEAETLAALVMLRNAFRDTPVRHAVSFHDRKDRAASFAELNESFNRHRPEYPLVDSFYVSGDMPTAARSKKITAFTQAHRGLVTNARCLTEGVDVPKIDAVLFVDPRRSTVDVVQAVGRALRPFAGKKNAYVLVPVVVDPSKSLDDLFASSSFKDALATIRALAGTDERIIEEFRAVSEARRKRSSLVNIKPTEVLSHEIDLPAFIEAVQLRYWSRTAALAWRAFGEARAFARSLNLASQAEWTRYCKGGFPEKPIKPPDIPAAPATAYAESGWSGVGDWLGTNVVATNLRRYRSFARARAFVHRLGLESQAEWKAYCNGDVPSLKPLPADIPNSPHAVYCDTGWSGFGDWLGTDRIATQQRRYRPFVRARAFVRKLGLRNQGEWKAYVQGQLKGKTALPVDIPRTPHQTYRGKGWKDLGDWLGTGYVHHSKRKYRTFESARRFARSLKLKGADEWRAYCRGDLKSKRPLPTDVPASPPQRYRNEGWVSWGDWLGTNRVHPSKRLYRSFKEARRFARSLRLADQGEWFQYVKGLLPRKPKLPADIPKAPQGKYKNKGWVSFGDWLGTGSVHPSRRTFRPFKEARAFARSLGLANISEWRQYAKGGMRSKGKLPPDIPANPIRFYKEKGWVSVGHWLGTNSVATSRRVFLPFSAARRFARSLRLANTDEWWAYCRGDMPHKGVRPSSIPSNPNLEYCDKGWVNMADWLGLKTR